MWSNVISIDKNFQKEIDYLLTSVKQIRDLSYAVEESKDRIWIYLASICQVADQIEDEIFSLTKDVILTFLKTRYFLDRLFGFQLNHASCSLLCSLVHFDRNYEENLLQKAVTSTADFNVDGLYNFRLNELKNNWNEVVDLTARLMASTDSDSYDIASFITSTEGAKARLILDKKGVFNATTGREVKILPVFNDYEYDLIMAVIGESPSEISVSGVTLSKDMLSALRRVAVLC